MYPKYLAYIESEMARRSPFPCLRLRLRRWANAFSMVRIIGQGVEIGGSVNDHHVITSVDASRLYSVAITGALRRPRSYPVFSQTTLLDMLSRPECLSDVASGCAVISRGAVGMHVDCFNGPNPEIPGKSNDGYRIEAV